MDKGRERDVEKYLKEQIENINGLCLKWRAVDHRGVPDRVCMLPWMGIFFVEIKRRNGRLSKAQIRVFDQFKDAGGAVFVAHGKQGVDKLIQYVISLKED